MTKTIRRALSLTLVFVLCTALALTAYAEAASDLAGIYGSIRGNCSQDSEMPHCLHTTTKVTRNPNGAYLKTEMECYLGETSTLADEAISETGATEFSNDFVIFVNIEGFPDTAYTNHYVMDPDTGLPVYDTYTYEYLVWNTTFG